MLAPEEAPIFNRMEGFKFDGVYEWVCLHQEEIHFKGWNPLEPVIKLCAKTLRVRANDAWTKLPEATKQAMVAHEMGHREYQHYLTPSFLERYSSVLSAVAPQKEVEADRYAAKLIGKEAYINILKERREYYLCSTEDKHITAYELELRIKELRN